MYVLGIREIRLLHGTIRRISPIVFWWSIIGKRDTIVIQILTKFVKQELETTVNQNAMKSVSNGGKNKKPRKSINFQGNCAVVKASQ